MARKADVRQVAARGYWREADARVVVEAWRNSGEAVSAFARRHRVEPKRLARWVRRLGRAGRARFHPVRLVETLPASGGGAAIEIRLAGGQRVRVAHGFQSEDLSRVLAVLAAARC